MLPKISIAFGNGALGSTSPSDDGVVGLIAHATAVADKLVLGTPYLVTKLADLSALGITSSSSDANARVYKTAMEFYSEAPEGTKLWILPVATSVALADMVDKDAAHAPALINAANGAIRLLIAKTATDDSPTVVDALNSDVWAAMAKAQTLGDWATTSRFAPLFTLLEGLNYSGTAASLRDLAECSNNRVGIVIGDTSASTGGSCIGLVAGRIAAIPVQRSIARVKSGAIAADKIYIGSVLAENGSPDVIHDMGYITARTFVGKAGYFFSDDTLATATTDDYALIPRRRTIDKAYRVAYAALIEELNDEVPVTDEGKIPAPIIKSLEAKVEGAIESNMTALGNLGNDTSNSSDNGVQCYIDPDQNILSSSMLEVGLRVKPYGYSKYINVTLGFTVNKTVN